MTNRIHVTVAYATPQKQSERTVKVAPNCTAALAIRQSGILEEFPEIDFSQMAIGIFARPVYLDAALRAGDRIEIYRPLAIDPKKARLRRLKKS